MDQLNSEHKTNKQKQDKNKIDQVSQPLSRMPRYTFHPDGKKLSGKRKEKEEKWGQRKGEKTGQEFRSGSNKGRASRPGMMKTGFRMSHRACPGVEKEGVGEGFTGLSRRLRSGSRMYWYGLPRGE